MDLLKIMEKLKKDSIRLTIEGKADSQTGCSRFGGMPDVPKDFAWPYCNLAKPGENFIEPLPLAFLAQIDCAALPKTSGDAVLPESGVLSFFYELNTMRWGYDPKDKGCARVFWFEDPQALAPMAFPEDLAQEYRLPAIGIKAHTEDSYPDYEDFDLFHTGRTDFDGFDAIEAALKIEAPYNCSKLLGWPNIIQNNMTTECEMVSRGHYMGGGWNDNMKKDIAEAQQNSCYDWQLLLQLDSVEQDGFELMFGDAGRIYFYIRKEDLKAKRFDRVWLILQCC